MYARPMLLHAAWNRGTAATLFGPYNMGITHIKVACDEGGSLC